MGYPRLKINRKKSFSNILYSEMTSWMNKGVSLKTATKKDPAFFFQPDDGGFCSNFNSFIYASIYAQKNAEPLYVYDRPNIIGENFQMLENILSPHQSIKYMKELPKTSPNLRNDLKLTTSIITGMSYRRLKERARGFFSWNGDILGKIRDRMVRKGIDRTLFDVGVHMRSGKTISIDNYVAAIRNAQKRTAKKIFKVFVMTDNYSLFKDLKDKADPSWELTTFCTDTPYFKGEGQKLYLSLPEKDRLDIFYQFCMELFIMQNIPQIIVSYSSNVGRFLYLTSRLAESPDAITSLDIPTWSPF